MMTEDQIKDATKGVMHQRRNQARTKMAAVDQAYAKSRYSKRSLIDAKKQALRDKTENDPVWADLL